MAVNYTQLPDYIQFVQSYFVDQELLDTQNVGTVLVQTAGDQNGTMGASASGGVSQDEDTDGGALFPPGY